MTCKNCGADIGADDKFCTVCGLSTAGKEFPHFCSHCGGALSQGDRFCRSCGSPVDEQRSLAPELERTISASRLYDRPKRRGTDVGAIILIIMILLCASTFLAGTLLHWWQL